MNERTVIGYAIVIITIALMIVSAAGGFDDKNHQPNIKADFEKLSHWPTHKEIARYKQEQGF